MTTTQMTAISSVLATTDFSTGADRAVRRAASLVSSLGGVLQVVHVLPPRALFSQILPPPPEAAISAVRGRADAALQHRMHLITSAFGITPSWALFHGQAHRAILDAVATFAADIVVAGAGGEHGPPHSPETMGDTTLKLAQRSRVPILIVRREPTEPYRAILACAKGNQQDRAVIGWANVLSPNNLLHIVSAFTVPYEERLIEWGASKSTIDVYAAREGDERMRHVSTTLDEMHIPAARARLHIERSAPLQLILRNAAELSADLIVVGRRAQPDPLGGGEFGSVARHVAFLAPMDVLIVPPESVSPS
jgi:nucleotide-binding universal stress UspA family protein